MILDLDTYETLGVFSYSEHVENSWHREACYRTARMRAEWRERRSDPRTKANRSDPRTKARERVRGAARRADPAERPVILRRQRDAMQRKFASFTPEEKASYLARRRELSAKYRAQETPAKREARLAKAREYQRRKKAQRTSHHSTEQATP